MSDVISTEMSGSILEVELCNAPVNAVTREMYVTLTRIFREAPEQTGVRCVLLHGRRQRAFCAGNSLHEFASLDASSIEDYLEDVQRCFLAIYNCAVPVVAAVHGAALGTGLVLASLADIRVVADDAFFALPEIDVGILGGQAHLNRMVGMTALRRMALTGGRVNALEALRLGIATEICESDNLEARAHWFANEIASKSPLASRMAKISLNAIEGLSLRDAYAMECSLSVSLRRFPEAQAAAVAALERRKMEQREPDGWHFIASVLRSRR